MTRTHRRGVRGVALAVLAATASTTALADADARLRVFGYARTAPVETIPDSIIDDWKYLDDRNVLVFRSGQAYLLEMAGSCPALQGAGVIGFNAAVSGLVAAKTLMVGGRNTQTECGVSQIVQLQRLAFSSAPPAPPPPRPRPTAEPSPPPVPAPAPTPAPPPAPAGRARADAAAGPVTASGGRTRGAGRAAATAASPGAAHRSRGQAAAGRNAALKVAQPGQVRSGGSGSPSGTKRSASPLLQ